jgi:hypothetical protein
LQITILFSTRGTLQTYGVTSAVKVKLLHRPQLTFNVE